MGRHKICRWYYYYSQSLQSILGSNDKELGVLLVPLQSISEGYKLKEKKVVSGTDPPPTTYSKT